MQIVLDFASADQVYARAKIDSSCDSVGLWLGANVMVEYALDEAKTLLETQLEGCTKQKARAKEDYDYMKEQVTTIEVCIAPIHNYNVELKRNKETA